MRIGAVFPQGGATFDAGGIRAFAEAAQDLGYAHLSAFDHVLGADPRAHDYAFPLTYENPYREIFVLFAFIAACAQKLGLCTSVLVLPQRQTALVAKQAADIDALSGGELRIAVGTGWNKAEYEALGAAWGDRGARLDEQIGILRALWTSDLVTERGAHHSFTATGINPRPERSIPIWVGGTSERALRRAELLGDGYIPPRPLPLDPADSDWPAIFERLRAGRAAAGREGPFGIEVRPEPETPDGWAPSAAAWRDAGATHFSVTIASEPGLPVDAHIRQLEEARAALDSFFEPEATDA